jgi:hypothetical protein
VGVLVNMAADLLELPRDILALDKWSVYLHAAVPVQVINQPKCYYPASNICLVYFHVHVIMDKCFFYF